MFVAGCQLAWQGADKPAASGARIRCLNQVSDHSGLLRYEQQKTRQSGFFVGFTAK